MEGLYRSLCCTMLKRLEKKKRKKEARSLYDHGSESGGKFVGFLSIEQICTH